MADLSYTFGDLWYDVALHIGTVSPTNSTPVISASTDTAKKLVNDAYRQFVTAFDWSFLKPEWQFTTSNGQWIYELPAGFVKTLTPIFYSLADSYSPIQQTSPSDILYHRSVSDKDSYPERFAIRPGSYDPKYGQRYEMIFYPVPDSSYTLQTHIVLMPQKLIDDADLPLGGPEFAGVLKQMCLAEAETNQDGSLGVQQQKADRMLMRAMQLDTERNPRTLGHFSDPYSQHIQIDGLRLREVSYDGVKASATGE
jgi:hypothetical protein